MSRRRILGLQSMGSLVLTLVVSVTEAGTAHAQFGVIQFPTSGSEGAQAHFIRGVAALHSFEYAEALEAFRAATRMDPEFAMGYWGEAMAHNHPIWEEQDTEAGRAALARITDRMTVTRREQAYLDAVGLLYARGEKRPRDRAYAEAMEKLYRDFPHDLEAACFYALSLLGLAEHGDDATRLRIRAGAIALVVFRENPQHPGAAHLLAP